MAKAILSASTPVPENGIPSDTKITPAGSPVTPTLQQRLTNELDAVHLATERLDSVINVIVTALFARNGDTDFGMAVCLENAAEAELNPARERIQAALELVKAVQS